MAYSRIRFEIQNSATMTLVHTQNPIIENRAENPVSDRNLQPNEPKVGLLDRSKRLIEPLVTPVE